MANKDAPFGFRPAKMLGGAPFNGGQTSYGIESGYNTNIFTGDAVELHSDGTITVGAAGATNLIGVFNGCFYTDTTYTIKKKKNLKRRESSFSSSLCCL